MSFELTATALALSKQTAISPQLILDIDGIPIIFGSNPILSLWRLDEVYFIDDDLRLDTPTELATSRSYISLNKTTKNISQQVTPDKSGTSSVSSVAVELIDKNQELSQLFKFGNNVEDILSLDATVYLTFAGATHPIDSIPVFRGYIDDYTVNNGSFKISVAHPENKKRTQLFNQYQDALTAGIDNTVTTIPVTATGSLIEAADIQTTYIRIDDEFMLVNSFTATTIDVVRGQFNSTAVTHDIEAEIVSVYRLQSQPIDMILKLYLSDENNSFFGSETIVSINQINANTFVQDAINFGETNPETELGLVEGDTVKISDSLEAGNNGDYIINQFNVSDGLYYAVVNDTLITVDADESTASFRSQYNVLKEGLGLTSREVDIKGHLDIVEQNPNQFEDLDFRLEDEIEAKEFCDKEVMYPSMLYSIPRKARISLKLVQPPLALNELVVIDESNILNMKQLSVKRSVNRFLYNQIVYKYEKLIGEDRFLRGKIIQNETSFNRIKSGKKQLSIPSLGLRNTATTNSYLDRQSIRLFERYQFAAQQINGVEIKFSTGVSIEIGDIVSFGSNGTQITDLNSGERKFTPRLMEVINKSLNFVNGNIKVSLLETAYDLESRYGVISMSSKTDLGSTTSEIKIKRSYDSADDFISESDKWLPYINQRIRIRNDDYTFDEIATLLQVKPSDDSVLILKSPISFVAGENYIVETPEYSDDISLDKTYKDQFISLVAKPVVTIAINNISFEVDRPDDLVVGSRVVVNSEDYTRDSFGEVVKIVDITGDIITLDKALTFSPIAGDNINNSNFLDNGFAYNLI